MDGIVFIGLGIVWFVGFTGFLITNKMEKKNKLTYFSVADKEKQFKKIHEKISGTQKKLF